MKKPMARPASKAEKKTPPSVAARGVPHFIPAKAKPVPAKPVPAKAKPAFPKRTVQPSIAEFTARLAVDHGKRLEDLRTFLLKQKDVNEEVYYYGPKAGWGLRYLRDGKPLCALLVHGERPMGVISLDKQTNAGVQWDRLSPATQQSKTHAHGSPSLLWLDVPLHGRGTADLKIILRTKIKLAGAPPAAGAPAGIAPASV